MKKSVAILAVMFLSCIIVFMPIVAFANSAQRRFFGVSSTGAIVTAKDCPVTVTAEHLTFNIGSYPLLYDDTLTDYDANVTAEYVFYNPADYDVNMQLVFPFGTIPDYAYNADFNDASKYSVFVNDVKADRVIRAVYSSSNSQFDISRDLPKISDEPILYKSMPYDTLVYKYTVKNTFEQYGHEHTETYAADFNYSGRQLFLSTQQDYSRNSASCKLRVYSSSAFNLYSIGQQLESEFFSADYYAILYDKQHNRTAKMVSGSTSFELETLSLGEFMSSYYDEENAVSQLDYRNAVATYLNDIVYGSNVYDFNRLDLYDNLMYWYQYDVSIPAGQTITNKVIAPLYPDINNYYSPSKYSYEYLLSPASSWADFSNLDVIIKTDYFMSNASLDGFEKIDGGYSAHFDKLPQGELTFDLCAAEDPDFNDESDFGAVFALLLVLFFPAMLLLGIVYGISILAIIIVALYLLWVIAAAIAIPLVMNRDKRLLQQRKQSCLTDQDRQLNDSTENKSNEDNNKGL